MLISKSKGVALQMAAACQARFYAIRARSERGDMPGWVLIAVVSAVIALIILGFFRESFIPDFQRKLNEIFK